MIGRRALAAIVVIAVGATARAQQAEPDALAAFEAEHLRAHRIELRGMDALTGGGILSTGVGVGLLATDRYDHALRVAGGVSAGFGVVNLMLGVMGIVGNRRSERAFVAAHDARVTAPGLRLAQLDDLRKTQQDTLLFAVNLGLDVGYVMAGGAAVIASQLGVDHADRWLAGGLSSMVQGLFLAGVDLTLTINARRRHKQLLDALVGRF